MTTNYAWDFLHNNTYSIVFDANTEEWQIKIDDPGSNYIEYRTLGDDSTFDSLLNETTLARMEPK